MTTNMQETISKAYQAGIEVGRNAAKHEMAELAKITAAFADRGMASILEYAPPSNLTHKRHSRVAKAAKADISAPASIKAPKVARGAKRASTGPRTKGVKEAIVNLIGNTVGGITVDKIVADTSFKKTSVVSTLAGLKKAGLASQDGKFWVIADSALDSHHGNSEHAAVMD